MPPPRCSSTFFSPQQPLLILWFPQGALISSGWLGDCSWALHEIHRLWILVNIPTRDSECIDWATAQIIMVIFVVIIVAVIFIQYLPSWLSSWSGLGSSLGWFFFLAAWAAFFSFSLCFFSAAFWAFVFTVGPSSCVLSSVLSSPSGSSLGSSFAFLPFPFLPFFFFLSSSEAHSASRSSTVAAGWGFASVLASPSLGFTTVWFADQTT